MILGIQRRIDNLGRLVLPKELRELYGIKDGDFIEITPTDKGLLLKKPNYKIIIVEDK